MCRPPRTCGNCNMYYVIKMRDLKQTCIAPSTKVSIVEDFSSFLFFLSFVDVVSAVLAAVDATS